MSRPQSDRRSILKAAGIGICLPHLESLGESKPAGREAPQRMVCIGNEFGMYPGAFWPKQTGRDYQLSPLLEPLEALRDNFTLFSNLDHDLKGGHFAVHTFLTGVKAAEASGMPDGGISLDQRAAEFVGSRTRFPSLTIGSDDGLHGGCRMSWTRTGTRVPPIGGPRELFKALFIDDDPSEKQKASDRIRMQSSILDAVRGDAGALQRRLSKLDRHKLDEYFTSIRDVESKLQLDQKWQSVRKSKVDFEQPTDQGLARDLPKLYDLIALALQTDSTRVATLEIGGSFAARDIGINKGYHGLSHHGKVAANIKQLVQIEKYQVEQFARFLQKLKTLTDAATGRPLLQSTMVLFGSGMGNANSHTNNDLPIILAGGGFRHGTHHALPREKNKRVPLCNLYVSMLQQFGVGTDRFGTSTGTLRGLETT